MLRLSRCSRLKITLDASDGIGAIRPAFSGSADPKPQVGR